MTFNLTLIGAIMCKYSRIICTKFKQNWRRSKEISMFQTKTLTTYSVTHVQPTGQRDRKSDCIVSPECCSGETKMGKDSKLLVIDW